MPMARVNGFNINYKVEGQGEPLVMLMGLSAALGAWSSQVPLLKKYYKVIRLDNRGAGKSDKPAGPYTTKMMADDTVGLMDRLGIEKANFMGVSMGGMIAQEIAINYPQRVNKLILASTYACNDNQLNGATAEMINAGPLGGTTRLISLAFNKRFNRFYFNFMIWIYSIFASATKGDLNKKGIVSQTEACLKHNTVERLAYIDVPTLVIAGTADRVVKPSSSDTLVQKIPHARLCKIEHGSHTCFLEMKRIFNKEVLNFLRNG